MKKNCIFSLIIGVLFIIASCTPYRYIMSNSFDSYYQLNQVDSICNVEQLPPYKTWKTYVLMDGETNDPIDQYFYIVKNDSLECVYTLTDLDTLYRFKKRVTKRINKKY